MNKLPYIYSCVQRTFQRRRRGGEGQRTSGAGFKTGDFANKEQLGGPHLYDVLHFPLSFVKEFEGS